MLARASISTAQRWPTGLARGGAPGSAADMTVRDPESLVWIAESAALPQHAKGRDVHLIYRRNWRPGYALCAPSRAA